MKFNDKYKNSMNSSTDGIYQSLEHKNCKVCQERTKWKFYWKRINMFGFPVLENDYICSEECLDFYDTVKGTLYADY